MLFSKKSVQEPDPPDELGRLAKAVDAADLPDEAKAQAKAEIAKLDKTDPSAAEYGSGFAYVEQLLALPWRRSSLDNLDLARAADALDRSHFGLAQVKERMLEHLAARILCQSRKPVVLVVDDEDIARENLAHALAKDGHRTLAASDGSEALAVLEREAVDLVLTDLKMERMDGLTLLQIAKAKNPGLDVVVITGFAGVDTAVQSLTAGAAHYLVKPVDLVEVKALVRRLTAKRLCSLGSKAPVLCFLGPPGVGKTSVGKALAEAMGRRFYRMSLADLRDEAELRGHRRTYVGAMPGRIIQALAKLGVNNPVFMLDEVDKIGADVRGDPAQALLEILDPEQNGQFVDRWLEIPFDLSQVLFIATANTADRLTGPVLDRMEPVLFTGYSDAEKVETAKRHILPKLLREHGLTDPFPRFEDAAIASVVQGWTNEAGLRGLERELARICRKLARGRLEKPSLEGETVDDRTAALLLGPPPVRRRPLAGEPRIGAASGLVQTPQGGEVVMVETARMPGTGSLILTGSLGEVLKESAALALSVLKASADRLGLDPNGFSGVDVHLHIPSGGVSKDGPSAGLTIVAALYSLFSRKPLPADVAFSAEISLTGGLLPVAGVKDKALAAQRLGVAMIVAAAANEPEWRAVFAGAANTPELLLFDDLFAALAAVFGPTTPGPAFKPGGCA